MILSPYRNPPYRTPTPQSPTKSPAEGPPLPPSPPRKGSASTELDKPAAINRATTITETAVGVAHPEHSFAPDSPRTKVADKLKDLDIQPAGAPRRPAPQSTSPRKRLKLDRGSPDRSEKRDSRGGSDDAVVVRSLTQPRTKTEQKHDILAFSEIGETPDCRTKSTRVEQETSSLSWSPRQTPHSQLTLQPALTDPSSLLSSPAGVPDRTVSPLPLPEDLPIDRASLTWQDSEITGHEIDTTVDGEDDGEGINGIGFKPTPAMAYARRQRRKQQVFEWKTREAREARQRRLERRRFGAVGETEGFGGSGAGDVGETVSMGRRMVRFEGVG